MELVETQALIFYADAKNTCCIIESNQKVMYVNTDEYKNAKNARSAYANAIVLLRANGIVRATRSRNDLFLIRNDI